jgi:hypothetical protein
VWNWEKKFLQPFFEDSKFNPQSQAHKTSNKLSAVINSKRALNGLIECSLMLMVLCGCLDFEVGLDG